MSAMSFHSLKWFARLRAVLVALFAASQLAPPGAAFAAGEDGEFLIVICTKDGAKTVSWEEATGEPSPFRTPEKDHSNGPCHACAAGACSIGKTALSQTFLPNVSLMAPVIATRAVKASSCEKVVVGPPLPSRSPPQAV